MSENQALSDFPLAYLITFTTYGSWLHGEEKGSVDRLHNHVGTDFSSADAKRLLAMQVRMSGGAIRLTASQRSCAEQAIEGVCKHRNWQLLAINVRTNHVHVVISAAVNAEKIMTDFKSWATRKLREAELIDSEQKVWSRHGSTRYLWDDRAIENACQYVVEGQGVDL